MKRLKWSIYITNFGQTQHLHCQQTTGSTGYGDKPRVFLVCFFWATRKRKPQYHVLKMILSVWHLSPFQQQNCRQACRIADRSDALKSISHRWHTLGNLPIMRSISFNNSAGFNWGKQIFINLKNTMAIYDWFYNNINKKWNQLVIYPKMCVGTPSLSPYVTT